MGSCTVAWTSDRGEVIKADFDADLVGDGCTYTVIKTSRADAFLAAFEEEFSSSVTTLLAGEEFVEVEVSTKFI